jgi:hypothetical protein
MYTCARELKMKIAESCVVAMMKHFCTVIHAVLWTMKRTKTALVRFDITSTPDLLVRSEAPESDWIELDLGYGRSGSLEPYHTSGAVGIQIL